MIARWEALAPWSRWLLYLPAVIFFYFISSLLFAVAAVIVAEPESMLGDILKLIGSAITTVILFWLVINLAPAGKRIAGWLLFLLMLFYVFASTISVLDGRSLLGQEISEAVGAYWIIQNVIWFIASLASVIYFTRQLKSKVVA